MFNWCKVFSKTTIMASKSVKDRAMKMLQQSPRIRLDNLKDNPGARTKGRRVRSVHNKAGQSHKELQIGAKPPLGWIYGDFYRPWTRIWPGEPYNRDIHVRREYPPLSLLELQRMIDLGWVDPKKPIDLSTLCATALYKCDPSRRQFGVQLTDEGADKFQARVNIEVQWASKLAIACVERSGGVIVTAYYDPLSLVALVNPFDFFQKGQPIPRRNYPPFGLMKYYLDAKNRGYLATEDEVQRERFETMQMFGFQSKGDQSALMQMRKEPSQVFYGLKAGWIVNLKDKCVLKPTDASLINYYNADDSFEMDPDQVQSYEGMKEMIAKRIKSDLIKFVVCISLINIGSRIFGD